MAGTSTHCVTQAHNLTITGCRTFSAAALVLESILSLSPTRASTNLMILEAISLAGLPWPID